MRPVGSRCLRIKNTESYERVRITWLNHLSVLCFSADTLHCVIVHSSAGLNRDCVTPPTLVFYNLFILRLAAPRSKLVFAARPVADGYWFGGMLACRQDALPQGGLQLAGSPRPDVFCFGWQQN